jgi:hypothetical protein
VVRCSWCSAPATTYVAAFYIPPCCDDDACAAESNAVNASLWDWRDAMAAAVESSGAAWASPLDVGAWRDARDAANLKATRGHHAAKLWEKFGRGDPPGGDPAAALAGLLSGYQMDPEVTARTLGSKTGKYDKDAVLAAVRKTLAVNRGEAEPDDRVTDAIYMDLIVMASDRQADLDAAVNRLAGYVSRPAALRENRSLDRPLAEALRVGRATRPRSPSPV